jgi:hypothetical protein
MTFCGVHIPIFSVADRRDIVAKGINFSNDRKNFINIKKGI